MLRRLRIAVSVFFALVAVAFAVLWVRSYWQCEMLLRQYADKSGYIFESGDGELSFFYANKPVFGFGTGTWFRSYAADEGQRAVGNRSDSGIAGFLIESNSTGVVCIFPGWFLVVLSGLLAALTSFRQLRRFSLRTMLIATTLIAVLLGLAVYATRAPKSPPFDHVDGPVF